ncbi:MAG: F420-0--gamma-glutamyl ligase [Tissierellia bacterium]|nr:F420-0--gamma-glutamyl ligase [Tissierellia bacterium]
MERTIGTVARGVRTPIVKEGDDVISIVVDSIINAVQQEKLLLKDRDIVGVTESLIARAQGNFATTEAIKEDVSRKFPGDIAIVFPILSRNRFSVLLKGFAETGKKIHLILNYPSDEVGNHLISLDQLDASKVNPYTDMLDEAQFRNLFGSNTVHRFTGIDYVEMYKSISPNISVYFANDPCMALKVCKDVIVADIHYRDRTKRLLKEAGAGIVYGLDDILTEPINGSGYNPDFGLLGSNLASDSEVKLFPRDGNHYVMEIQNRLIEKLNVKIEVLIYGDGAFKDPVGKIWELAAPVVSPAFTPGLVGTPHELKIKYIADTELKGLSSEEATKAMRKKIYAKDSDELNEKESLGTTPRQITDLLGSLCDLVSGSGDKGTPVVLIQGYFDNYASE